MKSKDYTGWWFLLPALFFFCVFFIYPIFRSIQLSFFEATIVSSKFVGLENYIAIFKTTRLLKAFLNAFKFTVVIVPIIIINSCVIAFIGFRMFRAVQTGIRFAYYIPGLTAGPVISAVWGWLFLPKGLLNHLLGTEILWFASNPMAFVSICIVLLATDMGMLIIIFMSALTSINPDLYDAAKLDGCNARQEDRYITLPLMMRTIAFLIFIKMIGVAQIWVYPFMLTGGGPNYGTNTIVLEIYLQAFEYGKYGKASAMGVLLVVIVGSLGFLQRRFFKGETYD